MSVPQIELVDTVGYEYGAGGQKGHSDYGTQNRGGIEKGVASYQDEYHAYCQVQVLPVPVLHIVEHKGHYSKYLYDKQGGVEIIKAGNEQGILSFGWVERHKQSHKQGQKKHCA